MKTYRRKYRSLLPISVFSRVQMVATAAFEATQRGKPLQFPDNYPFGGGGPRQDPDVRLLAGFRPRGNTLLK